MKILRIEFENLPHFQDGKCSIDFLATDRVFESSNLYEISRNIHLHNTIIFTGMNATGKTTALRLLKSVLQIVIYNINLNRIVASNTMLQDNTVFRVYFFHQEFFYLLESVIGIRSDESGKQAYYKEETLYSKRKSQIRTKQNLVHFKDIATNIVKRSSLDAKIRPYLAEDNSIAISLSQEGRSCLVDFLDLNHINYINTVGTTPNEVLAVFDESIEELSAIPHKNIMHYTVRFKNEDKPYDTTDMLALNRVISAGTIKGQGLISLSITALQKGGYLIVDELDAHLNKELVRVIIDLFRDPRTNPHGACIIFSTHYAEVLDFIERKDNIYITRKQANFISITKYADECQRNDVKKSEVILSNVLKGTAPSYEKVQRMRESICSIL